MKGYEMELETRIETTRKRRHINIDAHGEEVWLSMVLESARCHVTLTKDQAKDMIAALIRIVDAEVKP
jgi:chitinase